MIQLSRKKCLTAILFSILMISSTYTFVIPSTQAAEVSTEQKGLNALSNMMNLDLTKYTVATQENSQQPPSLGGLQQDTVLYTLTSTNSKLKLFYTYTNGNLQGLYVLETQGTPITKSAGNVNAIESAKSFLSNYQAYTDKQVFGELKDTLANVDSNKNMTKTTGNTVLEVTTYGDEETFFKWYYTANGAIAPYTKTIALGFKNGFLTSFIDNWDLYNIGSTNVNLTAEEAVTIALETAREHKWTMQLDKDALAPQNFNKIRSISWTTLAFDCSIDANTTRSKDALELYPVWKVGIVLNKAYGELYGLEVDIWADTKAVRSVNEQYSQLAAQWIQNVTANTGADTELDNQSANINMANISSLLLWVTVVGISATGFMVAALLSKKKSATIHHFKPRSLKTLGLLLCFVIVFVVFLPLIQSASATNGGIIWGARSSGAPNNPYSYSWRKTDGEISRQSYVTSYLASNFFTAANGYTGYSNHGVNKDTILYQAGYLRDNYNYMAIVDWDHGVGGYPPQASNEEHYMFEDDWGTVVGSPTSHYTDWSHGVYDMEIYNIIPPTKAHFVFIDACQSANLDRLGQGCSVYQSGNAVGLPFAFTHRIVTNSPTGTQMSQNGYSSPDAFPQCYIGFPQGSAALDQHIDQYGGYTDGTAPQWYNWIIFFYYFALDFDISVKDALDMASYQTWQCWGFSASPLQGNGFTAVWPMDLQAPWGQFENYTGAYSTLAVYGNSNIHLRNFQPSDYITAPDIAGPSAGTVSVSYQFSGRAIDSQSHNIQYRFDWGDGSGYTYTSWLANGELGNASHSWANSGTYNVRVQAQCANGQWSSWSNYRTINIDAPTLIVRAFDPFVPPYEVPVAVYVDGIFRGTTPLAIDLSPGNHVITTELNPGFGTLQRYYYFYDSTYYNPPSANIQVVSDSTIAAYYS
jgi:competence protein ComGC